MEARKLLEKLMNAKDLTHEESTWMMTQFMEGSMTPSQMAAMLIALRIKKETVTEISACASVMRDKATKIPVSDLNLLDTCGTGGDSSGSINISTTVALLLAGGGYKVAKHGNRSMTSKSGSADLLEALGVKLDLSPEQVSNCISNAGIGFMFAPVSHTAMKNVMPVRVELAVRTVFNVLGPLTNPAGARIQIIGLYTTELVSTIAAVLKQLGTDSAYVFSGESGLDEVCIAGNTKVAYLNRDGTIKEFSFNPEDYGFSKATLDEIKGGSPLENAEVTRQILNGDINDARKDVIVLNAGFAISAADNCSLEEGFGKAQTLINEKVGVKAIEDLVKISNSF